VVGKKNKNKKTFSLEITVLDFFFLFFFLGHAVE